MPAHPGGKVYDVPENIDKATPYVQAWAKGKSLDHTGRDSTMDLFPASFVDLPSPLGAEVLKCATVCINPGLCLRNMHSQTTFVQCALNSLWLPGCCICSHRKLELFYLSLHALKAILLLESDLDWRVPSGLPPSDQGSNGRDITITPSKSQSSGYILHTDYTKWFGVPLLPNRQV